MQQRKIEIFIQMRERIFVRRSANELQTICAECQTETIFIAPEQAAVEMKMTTREIFRGVESSMFHFIETNDGLMFVCLNSLKH